MPSKLEELKSIQQELAKKVKLCPLKRKPRLVAGADVSYVISSQESIGVFVVYDLKEKKMVAKAFARLKTTFPYIPGFLSFREVPVLKEAFKGLSVMPDVLLVDGQGILHPRGLGLASHLGLELKLPAIGVAKKPLVGEFEIPPQEPGSFTPIYLNGEVKGVCLRTRKGVKPVYVSPGHLITLEEALEVVKASLSGYRIPEPLRQAHIFSQRLRHECGDNSSRRDRK